jgi:DNA-binding FadR family transcriptional regulator
MIQRTQGRYEEALASYEKAYAILPASSSYQAIQELRHNIEVQEFNMAAEREDEEDRQQRREMEAKIERWNQFVEQN